MLIHALHKASELGAVAVDAFNSKFLADGIGFGSLLASALQLQKVLSPQL